MNKETKEILVELQRRNDRYNYCLKENTSYSDNDYKSHLLLDYINNLQEKIDNAIEYIKNNQEEHKFTDRSGFTYTDGYFLRDTDDLLNILQGSDKE